MVVVESTWRNKTALSEAIRSSDGGNARGPRKLASPPQRQAVDVVMITSPRKRRVSKLQSPSSKPVSSCGGALRAPCSNVNEVQALRVPRCALQHDQHQHETTCPFHQAQHSTIHAASYPIKCTNHV